MEQRHVDLKTWEIFAAVMKTGSCLKAARALSVDSSTVSRRLRRLEEIFEVQLFYRDSTGVFPTAPARSVYEQVRGVLEEILAVRSGASRLPSALKGRFTVEAPLELLNGPLQDLFAGIEAVHRGLEFEFATRGAGAPASLSFALGELVPAGFQALSRQAVVCAASPAYIERRGIPQSPEDLPDHRLVMGSVAAETRRHVFQRAGERLSMPLDASSVQRTSRAALFEALRGDGIAVGVPFRAAAPALERGELVSVPEGWRMEGSVVSLRLRRGGPPYLVSFLQGAIEKGLDDALRRDGEDFERLVRGGFDGK